MNSHQRRKARRTCYQRNVKRLTDGLFSTWHLLDGQSQWVDLKFPSRKSKDTVYVFCVQTLMFSYVNYHEEVAWDTVVDQHDDATFAGERQLKLVRELLKVSQHIEPTRVFPGETRRHGLKIFHVIVDELNLTRENLTALVQRFYDVDEDPTQLVKTIGKTFTVEELKANGYYLVDR